RGYGRGAYGGPALRLTEQQQQKIADIRRKTMDKNWDLIGKLRDEQEKLYNQYGQSTLDKSAVSETYKRMQSLRHKMFENGLDAQKEISQVLDPQQRKTWESMHRGMGYGMMDGDEAQ
ncbi:MAG TPA: Spy/CpxP family protein refolding chaperone, partial [Gammaproteobacteria bacterium]|nr:Spy/CpxP family protein refolding chaperone [Gammaproteobacteria bacterium]